MNDLAKKWLIALRSGKYKKTTGVLKRRGGCCVLGVACEVALKEGIPLVTALQYDDVIAAKVTTYDGEAFQLPEKVRAAMGLKNKNGTVGNTSLDILNDTSGLTLKELAAVIEFSAPLLFVKDEK